MSKSQDFEGHIDLKEIAPDTFQPVAEPWLFHITYTVPGPWMMALAANAAYKTVPAGFQLNSLHTQFMLGPKPSPPLELKVQRTSDGRRFATRTVILSQNGKACVTVTTSFMANTEWRGRAMQHTVKRETSETIEKITLDDFDEGRSEKGPFMSFQRLQIVHKALPPSPETSIAPVAAKILTPIQSPDRAMHILGVVHLSDYHVMDCPLVLYGVDFGQSAIGDYTRKATKPGMKIFTSLNHTVHIHRHDDWRADEMMYVEVSTSWAGEGRAWIQSRIFDTKGVLVATCVQEAFFVFKDSAAKL